MKKKKTVLILIFLLTLAVIWGQSAMSVTNSRVESNIFVEAFEPIHGVDVPDDVRNEAGLTLEYINVANFIRKIAHIIEYGVLAVEITLLVIVFGGRYLNEKGLFSVFAMLILFAGITVGLVDETIQIFSHRGAGIGDIWIDTIGVVLGEVLVFAVYLLKSKHKRAYE